MKVRCKFCCNTDGTTCNLKGFKVGQNKSRICDDFLLDQTTIKQPSKMEATYTPYHLRSKKAYKAHLKEEQQNRVTTSPTLTIPDCLSKYRATVPQD